MASRQGLNGNESRAGHRHNDELRDAIADRDRIRHRGVGVQQGDANLSAVAGVDGTWRVDDSYSVLGSEAAARHNKCRIAVGQSYCHTRADSRSRAGLESHCLCGDEIGPGVTGVRINGCLPRRNEYVNAICHETRVVQNIRVARKMIE